MPLPVSQAPLSEERRAVDDGYLWPVERARMVEVRPIRDRMVEDITAAVNDGGADAVVCMDDLRRKGWTGAQVEAHATGAFAFYNAELSPRRPRRTTGHRDSIGRVAGSAAAALVFLASTGLIAGLFTGAL